MTAKPKDSRTTKKLAERNFKLNTLLEITHAINNNESTETLIAVFKKIIVEELGIGKVLLFSHNQEWRRIITNGIEEADANIDIQQDLSSYEKITVLTGHENVKLRKFDVLLPVTHNSRKIAYLLLGDLDVEKIEVSPIIRHLPYIQTFTNIFSVALENKRLYAENILQARMERELELASRMQNMLIPIELPNNQHLEVDAYYKPHHKVGGDYYDVIHTSEQEFFFCMADISGKGISAALLMSNFQANLRAHLEHNTNLDELIQILNHKVELNTKGQNFITLFIGKYNLQNRTLEYINAGHNPPLLFQAGDVSELDVGCTLLGAFEELPSVKTGRVQMIKNSILLCYTDGISEIENDMNEAYGVDKMKSLLIKSQAAPISSLNESILKDIDAFRGPSKYDDDVALLGFRFY